MSRWTWTITEIHSCPQFGGDVGWFYGLVRDGWRLRLAEVFPGMGYSTAWPLGLRELRMVARDVRHTQTRKQKYVGGASSATNQHHFNVSLDTCVTLSEFINENEAAAGVQAKEPPEGEGCEYHHPIRVKGCRQCDAGVQAKEQT